MEKGDFRDEEKPLRFQTQREREGQREKMKCCECNSVGIYWNEKRNLYYCPEHNPRRPISEEFALKPIARDKSHIYAFSNKSKNPQTADRFRQIINKKSTKVTQYE